MTHGSRLALILALATTACAPEQDDAALPTALPPAEPGWFAAFGGADEQFLFVTELRRYFAERGEESEIDADGRLRVIGPAGAQLFVVKSLAEVAAETPPDDWRDLIERHFEAMAALRDAVGDVTVPDWDEARPRLRLRLYPDEFLTEAGLAPQDVVHRVDLPGTRTVLVIDSDKTAMVVPTDELARWGQAADNALALGFANTRRALDGELEVVEREFPVIGSLKVITGESFYAASSVLWLADWPQLVGEHGTILAVPWRHGVFAYPFDDARVMRVVPALHLYAERIAKDSSGPIGAKIWWRRPDGTFAAIQITEEEGRPAILPPRDMAELLESMR